MLRTLRLPSMTDVRHFCCHPEAARDLQKQRTKCIVLFKTMIYPLLVSVFASPPSVLCVSDHYHPRKEFGCLVPMTSYTLCTRYESVSPTSLPIRKVAIAHTQSNPDTSPYRRRSFSDISDSYPQPPGRDRSTRCSVYCGGVSRMHMVREAKGFTL